MFLGCLSSVSPNIVPVIQDYFPNIEIQNNYFGGTTYLFSKQFHEKKNTIDNLCFDSINSKSWSSIDSARIISINDSIKDGNVYFIKNETEWGPTFSGALKDIMRNDNNFIDISVKVKTKDDLDGVILVGSLESNGKNIYWGGTEFNEFVLPQDDNSIWIIVHHSIKLSDIYLKHDDIVLKIYIWNKGRKNFIINDFDIKLRKGNPIIYGLFEKI